MSFKTIRPPLSTATFDLRTDYLNGAHALRPFYHYPLSDPDFAQIIQDRSQHQPNRQALYEVLMDQYRGLEMGTAVQQNIERLRSPHTFTLTTGHQLVLFGGPLFTVYKIVSTIRLAEELAKAHPEHQFVPLFWIHTEDHDFEEINHYYTHFGEKHTYPGAFQGKVGDHVLESAIQACWPAHFPRELQQAYLPGRDLATATRHFFHTLFRDYGLVILDADDARLKQQFQDVIQADIEQHVASERVQATSVALKKAGYRTQINPREINFFYLDQQGRDRLVTNHGHVQVAGRDGQFSPEEMRQLVMDHPERFSPNVSLRPLYQEMILPNLAYFGGWGELSYWLQLKGVFDHFGVNFPLVLPRFSATVLPQDWLRQWEAMGFSGPEVRKGLHQLYQQYMPQVWDSERFDQIEARILEEVEVLRQYIEEELSPTLARSADALRTKNLNYLSNLRKKAHRVMRHRQPEPFAHIEALKLQVQPDGQVQERVWSLATVARWKDLPTFLHQVHQACQPLNFGHQFLEL